ncbi:hypothetical protein Golob_026596, partial [Gossypium lobatum]|nr:hypothetical protein [Gossypium lobatum]
MQVVLTSTRSDDGVLARFFLFFFFSLSSERGQNLDSTGMLGLGVVILISSRLAFFFRLLVPVAVALWFLRSIYSGTFTFI